MLATPAPSLLLMSGSAQADIHQARKKIEAIQSDVPLKLKDDYSGISWVGNSVLPTAMLNHALETTTRLIKKRPKRERGAPEQDGKTIIA